MKKEAVEKVGNDFIASFLLQIELFSLIGGHVYKLDKFECHFQ
jgi:hypothetical protein